MQLKAGTERTLAGQSGENACHVGIGLIGIAFLTTVNFCIDHWRAMFKSAMLSEFQCMLLSLGEEKEAVSVVHLKSSLVYLSITATDWLVALMQSSTSIRLDICV